MARLYRPHISLTVKSRVLLRQLGEMFPDKVIAEYRQLGMLENLVLTRLAKLAILLDCQIKDLRLDHDPPLGARERTGEGKDTQYRPAACDPDYLCYRPHGTAFANSHDVKTRIRGDHGQYSDLTLIKRERRRQRPPKPKQKIPSRPKPWAKRKFPKRGK